MNKCTATQFADVLFIGTTRKTIEKNIYLIGKKFVGKKWTKFSSSDEKFYRRNFLPTNYFYRRIFFADENFKIVLFCNNFSCRSKVSGSLIYYEFIVCGIQLIQGNNEKRRNLLRQAVSKKCSRVEY